MTCADSVSPIKLSLLFALSGLNQGRCNYSLAVDKQVWVEREACNANQIKTAGKTCIYEYGIYEVL